MGTTKVDPKVAAAVLAANPARYGYSYIGAADTARLVRSALGIAFPGFKFRVRSDNFAGGCSVDVAWTDGPTEQSVDAAISGIVGRGFDGMIDMAYDSDCWIDPVAGTVGFAGTEGTEGSRGYVPRVRGDGPAGASLVSFGPYISTQRRESPGSRSLAVDALRADYGPDFADDRRVYVTGGDPWRHSGQGLVSGWLARTALPAAPPPQW